MGDLSPATPSPPEEEGEFWIFGYGSLIWKPPPEFDRRVPGFIKGYVRRFWQASQDHRGTPEAPGRVVTLIERSFWSTLGDHHSADTIVWGTAYRFPPSSVPRVKDYLDLREINGYTLHTTLFHQASPEELPIKAHVYIGTPSNPQFVANDRVPDVDELAAHIFRSSGPSGENRDYLYQLHHALEELCPESKDEHVGDLFRRVAILEAEERLDHPEVEHKGADEDDPRAGDEMEEAPLA